MTYFWGDYDEMIVPHFRACEGAYLFLALKDIPMSQDEMFAYVIENNVII